MAKEAQNTARRNAMLRRVQTPMKQNGKNLSQTQFLAERYYRICLQVVSALIVRGLLTEKEAVHVRKKLKRKYKPVIGLLTDDGEWREA